MKIARATDADIEMALELAGALESLTDSAMPQQIENSDDGSYEPFDLEDRDQCVRVCKYLTTVAEKGSLWRVALGMSAVLNPKNNITDPNADTLEPSPRIQAMESALDELRQWVEAYPLSVFPEPDIHRAHQALQSAGITPDAVAASIIRSTLTRVREILAKVGGQ